MLALRAKNHGSAMRGMSAGSVMSILIDVENAISVDVETTTAIRQAEMTSAKRMVERSITRFDFYPERLIGDSSYGSGEMLKWLTRVSSRICNSTRFRYRLFG